MLEQCLSGAIVTTSTIKKAKCKSGVYYFISKAEVFLTTKKLLVMSLIQRNIEYACYFWYPGLSIFLTINLRLPKINIICVFLTWIQGHM